jgi:hypothetical protein
MRSQALEANAVNRILERTAFAQVPWNSLNRTLIFAAGKVFAGMAREF